MDVKRVNYIHIAGHDEEHSAAQVVENSADESFNKVKGAYRHLPELLIDTHGEAVKGTVWDLLEYAYQRLPTIPQHYWNVISTSHHLQNFTPKLSILHNYSKNTLTQR